MRLIDDSPGAFMALAYLVVYGVIGVEIWMWTSPTVVVVASTLVLIASIAIGLGLWMHRLLEDEATTVPVARAVPEVTPHTTATRGVAAAHPATARMHHVAGPAT